MRFIVAALVAIFSFFSYCSNTSDNPVTGEKQRISITQAQEVMIGQRAAPRLAEQHGGLSPDRSSQALIDRIGGEMVEAVDAELSYRFDFHVLADSRVVNAFALPGGQVFMTQGLLDKLDSEDQIAGVLAHEVAHVVARHSAEHIAKQQLTQGLTGATIIATYDPSDPRTADTAQMTILLSELVNMKFGREDELEADTLGVRFMMAAGYKPEALIEVMDILEASSQGGLRPEFLSSHPSPNNRRQRIREAIEQQRVP